MFARIKMKDNPSHIAHRGANSSSLPANHSAFVSGCKKNAILPVFKATTTAFMFTFMLFKILTYWIING